MLSGEGHFAVYYYAGPAGGSADRVQLLIFDTPKEAREMAQKWDLVVHVFDLDLHHDLELNLNEIYNGALSAGDLVNRPRLKSWLTEQGFDLNRPIDVLCIGNQDRYDFRQ